MVMATSERVPLMSSAMRSSMGWENEKPRPGSASVSRADIRSTSSSRVVAVVHSS
jgi:hypothetical protein